MKNSMFCILLLLACTAWATLSHGAQVYPVSYDMANGQRGSYSYYDWTYNGSGDVNSAGSALSGGVGQLTDDIIGSGDIVAELGNNRAFEWVGWTTITPVITFQFSEVTTFSELKFVLGRDMNRATNNVNLPSLITIEFGVDDGAGGVAYTDTFTYDMPAPFQNEWKSRIVDVPLDRDYDGQVVRVTLTDGNGPWIFLSEVMFFDALGTGFPATISYDNFDDTTGLYFVSNYTTSKDTAFQVGKVLELTPAADFKTGGVVFHELQSVDDGFYTDFEFAIDQLESSGADGFAFVVSNSQNWGAGSGSPGRESLTLQFDTYDNGSSDPSNNHVTLYGMDNLVLAEVDLDTLGIIMEDGNVHRVEVYHSGQHMSVRIDGQWIMQGVYAPTANACDREGKAQISMGAYVGSIHESITLLNWHFTTDFSDIDTLSSAPAVVSPRFDHFLGYPNSDLASRSSLFVQRAEIALLPATSGSDIRYTTDGSEPTAASALYSAPLIFAEAGSYEIKARAFKSGLADSQVVTGQFYVLNDGRGQLTHEHWNHIWGSSLALLTDNPVRFPDVPTRVELQDMFEINRNTGDYYGTRLSGYVHPPETGNYVFYIASDNQSKLYLSTDDDPANKAMIASVTSYTGYRNWGQYPEQTSAPIALEAGKRYYIEAVHTEGTSADHLAVGWQLPSSNLERPIPGSRLSMFGGSDLPGIEPVVVSPRSGIFAEPVNVTLSHPLAGATIYYTTDGSEPTTASSAYPGSPINLATTTEVKVRAFNGATPVSGVGVYNYTFDSSSSFSRDGLVQWYRADTGVTERDGKVEYWQNLVSDIENSGFFQYNESQQPSIVADASGGQPGVRFDGSNDGLLGDDTTYTVNPYTIFIVYQRLGILGRTIQSRSTNFLLGLHSAPGYYANGWVRNNAPGVGTENAWELAIGTRAEVAQYFLDGQNYTTSQTPSGQPNLLALGGGEGVYNEPTNADIAEILVFNRGLTELERLEVEAYIASRYAMFSPELPAPTISPPTGNYESNVSVSLDTLTPGTQIYYTTDGSEPDTDDTLYTGSFTVAADTVVKAKAFKSGYLSSPIASAQYEFGTDIEPIDTNGLFVWMRADRGLTTDENGRVVRWEDSSGNGHIATTSGYSREWRPRYEADGINGLPALNFEGSGLRIDDITVQRPSTVFVVYQSNASGGQILQGSSTWYLGQNGSTAAYYSGGGVGSQAPLNSGEPSLAVAVQDLSSSRFYFNGDDYTQNSNRTGAMGKVALGGRLGYTNSPANANIGEVIIYNRTLTPEERLKVETYLANKYNIYNPQALAPTIETPSQSSVDPLFATISNPDSQAELRYTLDGSIPTLNSPLYTDPIEITTITELKVRAFRAGYEPSRVIAAYFEIGGATTAFSKDGLQLWLRADRGISHEVATLTQLSHFISVMGDSLAVIIYNAEDDSIQHAIIGPHGLPSEITNFYAFAYDHDADQVFALATNSDAGTDPFRQWLVKFDPLTGTGSVVGLVFEGPVGSNREFFEGLAYSRTDGLIGSYIPAGVSFVGRELRSMNTTDATSTFLSTSSPSRDNDTLVYVEGRGLLGGEANGQVALWQFDSITSGSNTTIGSGQNLGDPAYDEDAGVLFNFSNDTLYAIDLNATSPRAVSLGTVPGGASGLAYLPDAVAETLNLEIFGSVAGWSDVSGNGFDAISSGFVSSPQLVTSALNGEPVLQFDGVNDGMLVDTGLYVSRPMTTFVVFARTGNTGRILQSTTTNWLLGLHSNSMGFYANGWVTNSIPSPLNTGYLATATQESGSSRFYLNGADLTQSSTPGGELRNVAIGGGAGTYFQPSNAQVAEILIYDRVLNETERRNVDAYLANKYDLFVPTATTPIVLPQSGFYDAPINISMSSSMLGATLRYTLDGSDPDETSMEYTAPFELTTSSVLKARAFVPGFAPSNIKTYTYEIGVTPGIPDDNIALWLDAEESLTLDANNQLEQWGDLSGNGYDAFQFSVDQRPVQHSESGRNYVRFTTTTQGMNIDSALSVDGDYTAFVAYKRYGNPASGNYALLQSNSSGWFLGPYSTIHGFYHGSVWISPSNITPQQDVAYISTGTRRGTSSTFHLNGFEDTARPYDYRSPGQLALGWEGTRSGQQNYDLAEVIVYERALSAVERRQVEDYLAQKWNVDLTPDPVAFSIRGGHYNEPVQVELISSDVGDIYYTLDGSTPDPATATLYTGAIALSADTTVKAIVEVSGGAVSPVATETFFISSSQTGSLLVEYYGGVRSASVAGLEAAPYYPDEPDSFELLPSFQSPVNRGQYYGARLRGYLYPPQTGDYTFWVASDNGGQLWLSTDDDPGNKVLIAEVTGANYTGVGQFDKFASQQSALIPLEQGRRYYIEGLLGETTGSDHIEVQWQLPDATIEWPIPGQYLSPFGLTDEPSKLIPPTIAPAGGLFASPVNITLTHPSADVEIRYTMDGSEPDAASSLYTAPFTVAADGTVKARAFKTGFTDSNASEADFYFDASADIERSGLALWFRADTGVEASSGSVASWQNLAQTNNPALQSLADAQPTLVASSFNGLPAIRFDGVDDQLDFNPVDVDAFTIAMVFSGSSHETWAGPLSNRANGQAGFYLGSNSPSTAFYQPVLSQWNGSSETYNVTTATQFTFPFDQQIMVWTSEPDLFINGFDETVISASGTNWNRPAAAIGYAWEHFGGDIAEILVYDRELSELERVDLEDYLAARYAQQLKLNPPTVSPNGGMLASGSTVEFTHPIAVVEFRYTLDGTEPDETSMLYAGPITISSDTQLKVRSYLTGYTPSDTKTLNFYIDAETNFSRDGMAFWIRADVAVLDSDSISELYDLSGNGLNATQTVTNNQPLYSPAAVAGQPSITFDGSNDYLRMPAGFSDFSQGITAFVVAKPQTANSWARFFDLGRGQANNNIFLARELTTNNLVYDNLLGSSRQGRVNAFNLIVPESVNIYGLTHETSGVATLFKNGVSQVSSLFALPPTTERTLNYIARSNWSADGYYSGEIAEVIIYNRALNNAERTEVETYLRNRYGIASQTVATPVITPGPAFYEESVVVSMGTASPGATIHYTTDGSVPDQTDPLYTGPFTLNDSAWITARAFLSGFNDSLLAATLFRVGSAAGSGDGLAATYYDNIDFTGTTVKRIDPFISFTWNGFAPDTLINADTYSVVWEGEIEPRYSETYTFTMEHDDGARVYIDNNLVIDRYINGSRTTAGTIALTRGQRYPIRIEYFENTANALARLRWSSFSQPDSLVPITQLYSLQPYNQTVFTPRSSPRGNVYPNQVIVSLSTPTNSSSVYYTTDGTDPDTNSTLYTAPFVVSTDTLLKAIAYRSEFNPSGILVEQYTIDSTGPALSDLTFNGLPAVNGQVVSGPGLIGINATDTAGISRVDFYIQTEPGGPEFLLGSDADGGNGYTAYWNADLTAQDGLYQLRIVAFDTFNSVSEVTYNVNLVLATPAAPVINLPANNTVTAQDRIVLRGTAPLNTTVYLILNGVQSTQSVNVGANGTFETTLFLASGSNTLAAIARNRKGDSVSSAVATVELDTSIPLSPPGFTAQARSGGRIRLSWLASPSSNVTGYNLYRSSAPFTNSNLATAIATNINDVIFNDIPPADGEFFYRVETVNAANITSPLSEQLSAVSDRVGPVAASVVMTHRTPSLQNGNRLGVGTVDVALVVDEPLSTTPFLSLNPNGSNSIVIPLNPVTETLYEGVVVIETNTADGVASITFSGRDAVGNGGASVQSGAQWAIDTAGPRVIALEIVSPEVPIKNDPDPAQVDIAVTLSEVPAQTPVLAYYLTQALDTTPIPIELAQGASALEWTGSIELPNDAGLLGEDYLTFEYTGIDDFGNTSTVLEGDNAFLVYQGDLPGLDATGSFFGEALPGGVIRLNWLAVDQASGYRLFRTDPNGSTLQLLADISDAEILTYEDTTPVDATYQYAVAPLRNANGQVSEGDQSNLVTLISDSLPPLPPASVQLELTPQGIALSWLDSPSALSETLTYSIYRGSDNPITTTAGQRLLAADLQAVFAIDPNPTYTEPSYVVTAVDAIGNESTVSNSEFLNVGLLPVQDIEIFRQQGFAPLLSWSAAAIPINAYEIAKGAGDNQQVVTTTTGTGYTDTFYTSGDETYTVTVIDTFNQRSLGHSLLLPAVQFTLDSDARVRRGLMNRLYYDVTNHSASPINNATLKVELAGRSHQSATFNLAVGATATVSVVVGGYAELTGSSAQMRETLEIQPNPGELVRLQQSSTVAVAAGGLLANVLGSGFERGTAALVSFTLFNPSQEMIEVPLSRANGSQPSSEVRFNLLDNGNVISSAPVQVATGAGIVALSNGTIVARIPGNAEFTLPEVSLPIPINAPRDATLQLEIDTVYYNLGRPDEVVLSGAEAIAEVVIKDVDYGATVTDVTPQVARNSVPITISGQTLSTADGSISPNLPLTVVILHEGFERSFNLTSDASGLFEMTFQPLEGESGAYQVWARHPDLNERQIQASFAIQRVSLNPGSARLRVPRGVPFNFNIAAQAAEGTAVNNLRFEVVAEDQTPPVLPTGLSVSSNALNLASGSSGNLAVTFTSDASTPASGTVVARLLSDEATTEGWTRFNIDYTLTEGRPNLVTSKSSFNFGANPGGNGLLELSLSNQGVVAAQSVELALLQRTNGSILPAPGWLSLTVPAQFPSLSVGSSINIGMNIAVPDNFGIGTYEYGLRIRSSNHPEIIVPIDLAVTSDEEGNLLIKVLDIYTGEPDPDFDGSPDHPTPNFSGVRGVRVTLQNELVSTQIFNGVTNGLGELFLEDMPAGRYKYRLTSDGHSEVAGRVFVQPGTTTTETAQMQNTRVVVQWEVVPITIEDRYEILLEATFETEVPAPVVVVTPSAINLPRMCPGDVFSGEITLANYGLIRADDFVLPVPPSDSNFFYELLDAVPETLEAGEVRIIPYRVTCLAALPGNCDEISSEDETLALAETQSSGCSYTICVPYAFDYDCANGLHFSDGGWICWVASGSGCGGTGGGCCGGGGYGGGFFGGGPGGGSGPGWGTSSSLPNQPPDCECDPDPCCEAKGK